jgi:DNA-binding HxlR family transcriptional regulator
MITDQETRIFLYQLETLGMIKCVRERKKGLYKCTWELTDAGKQLIESNQRINKLWQEQKIQELCEAVKSESVSRLITIY